MHSQNLLSMLPHHPSSTHLLQHSHKEVSVSDVVQERNRKFKLALSLTKVLVPQLSLTLSLPNPSMPCLAFTLFQLVAVGSASFFAAALLSALAYTYCHHLNRPSAESAVIHPSTPNHLTYNKQGNDTPKNEKYILMEFKVGWFNLFILHLIQYSNSSSSESVLG